MIPTDLRCSSPLRCHIVANSNVLQAARSGLLIDGVAEPAILHFRGKQFRASASGRPDMACRATLSIKIGRPGAVLCTAGIGMNTSAASGNSKSGPSSSRAKDLRRKERSRGTPNRGRRKAAGQNGRSHVAPTGRQGISRSRFQPARRRTG